MLEITRRLEEQRKATEWAMAKINSMEQAALEKERAAGRIEDKTRGKKKVRITREDTDEADNEQEADGERETLEGAREDAAHRPNKETVRKVANAMENLSDEDNGFNGTTNKRTRGDASEQEEDRSHLTDEEEFVKRTRPRDPVTEALQSLAASQQAFLSLAQKQEHASDDDEHGHEKAGPNFVKQLPRRKNMEWGVLYVL